MAATKPRKNQLRASMEICASCSCAVPASVAISCVHPGCTKVACKPACYLKHLDTPHDAHQQQQG